VPRQSTQTRSALIRAAEQLFAREGVHTAQTRDIVRLAGQANDSAVHYHFGSRYGLLAALCAQHIAEMEPARQADLEALRQAELIDDLPSVVGAVIAPMLGQLRTESGRDFLQIAAQLSCLAGVGTPHAAPLLAGTALREQLGAIEAILRPWLSRPVLVMRIASAINLLTAALADRARVIATGTRRSLTDSAFANELNTIVVAVLAAPPS